MPYKRGKIWYAIVYDPIEGKHIRESSKSTKKADAEKLEEQIRKRIEEAEKRKGYISFSQAMVLYIENHMPTLRQKTQEDYTIYARTLCEFFKSYYVQEIDATVAKEFRNWMTITKKIPDRSMALRMRFLSSFLTYCADVQIIERNPIYGMRMKLPPVKVRSRVFTRDEQIKMLSEAKGDMKIFVLLCLECGLRRTEALSVRAEDIDFEKRTLTVPDGKGGKSRVVPVTKAALRRSPMFGQLTGCF